MHCFFLQSAKGVHIPLHFVEKHNAFRIIQTSRIVIITSAHSTLRNEFLLYFKRNFPETRSKRQNRAVKRICFYCFYCLLSIFRIKTIFCVDRKKQRSRQWISRPSVAAGLRVVRCPRQRATATNNAAYSGMLWQTVRSRSLGLNPAADRPPASRRVSDIISPNVTYLPSTTFICSHGITYSTSNYQLENYARHRLNGFSWNFYQTIAGKM